MSCRGTNRFIHFLYIMQIYIKTLTGRKQALNFESDSTVLEVKQALQEKEGIQVDQIRYVSIIENASKHAIGSFSFDVKFASLQINL